MCINIKLNEFFWPLLQISLLEKVINPDHKDSDGNKNIFPDANIVNDLLLKKDSVK